MHDSEIKLLQLKCQLLNDIKSSRRQIDYHIIEGAKSMRCLLQENIKDAVATLNADVCGKMINYFLSVERESMYTYGTNQYLKEHYNAIEIKEGILKTI